MSNIGKPQGEGSLRSVVLLLLLEEGEELAVEGNEGALLAVLAFNLLHCHEKVDCAHYTCDKVTGPQGNSRSPERKQLGLVQQLQRNEPSPSSSLTSCLTALAFVRTASSNLYVFGSFMSSSSQLLMGARFISATSCSVSPGTAFCNFGAVSSESRCCLKKSCAVYTFVRPSSFPICALESQHD